MLEAVSRSKCFEEVNLGLTLDEAVRESKRCLECKNPRCVSACPVGN